MLSISEMEFYDFLKDQKASNYFFDMGDFLFYGDFCSLSEILK
jgi:hypothetical protein